MKIHLLGAEMSRADRQTDGHNDANSHVWKFCESVQNFNFFYHCV